MKLALQRLVLTANSTCGNLFVNDALQCWTLEEPFKDGLSGSCITAGTYEVTLGPSPKFQGSSDPWERTQGQCIPHLQGVPNRQFILIHWGNTAKNTEGCILVGHSHSQDFIGQSRAAFTELIEKLKDAVNNGETISLVVEDRPSDSNG
jgi:Family of unknown function (DUF5675)